MSTNLQAIYNLSRKVIKDPLKAKWGDATLLVLVNRAMTLVASDLKLQYSRYTTMSTISGTATYALTAGFKSFYTDEKAVVYTDASGAKHYPTPVDFTTIYKQYGVDAFTDTGTPTSYYVLNGKDIGFYPVPNYTGSSNVSYVFNGDPTPLVNLIDNMDLSDSLLWAVALKVGVLAWKEQNNPANATIMATIQSLSRDYDTEIQRQAVDGTFPILESIDFLGVENTNESEHTI